MVQTDREFGLGLRNRRSIENEVNLCLPRSHSISLPCAAGILGLTTTAGTELGTETSETRRNSCKPLGERLFTQFATSRHQTDRATDSRSVE
jgi:hypothetical protein